MNSRTLLILGLLVVLSVIGAAVWTLLDDTSAGRDVATLDAPATTQQTSAPPTAVVTHGGAAPQELDKPVARTAAPIAEPLPATTVYGSATGRVIDLAGIAVVDVPIVAFISGEGAPFRTRRDLAARAKTDGDGRFTIDQLPVGSPCGLEVLPLNFAPTMKEPFVVTEGSVTDLGTIVVRSGVSVTGLITDVTSGVRLRGVTVNLHDLTDRYRRGGVDAGPAAAAISDENGRYTFENLAMRQYELALAHEGYIPLTTVLTFVLSMGDKPANQDFALERAEERLDGVVVSIADGTAVPDVVVRVSRRQPNANGFFSATAVSDPSGAFSFEGLPAGRLTLELRSQRWFLPSKEMIDSPSTNLVVEAQRAQWVDVQLVAPEGATLPDEVMATIKPVPGGRGALVPTATPQRTFSDLDAGRFRFEGLRDGAYALEIAAEGFAVTRSPQFELQRGGESTSTDVPLVRGATVIGTVKPANSKALVELRSADYDPSLSIHSTFPTPPIHGLRTTIAADGTFALEQVPGGSYVLSILAKGSPPVHKRDFEVATSGVLDIGTVELPIGGIVVGQVLGPDGQPREGTTVLVTNAEHHSQVSTDAEGVFRLDALPAGTYEITATPGRANFWEALRYEAREQITVTASQQSRVTLTLTERKRQG